MTPKGSNGRERFPGLAGSQSVPGESAHRPAQQGRRSVEAFAIGLADNAPIMDDDRAHARPLENRIVRRRPQTTIIGQLRRLAGRPKRVRHRQRQQWRRAAVPNFNLRFAFPRKIVFELSAPVSSHETRVSQPLGKTANSRCDGTNFSDAPAKPKMDRPKDSPRRRKR
jgi:hypothetical protein